MEIASQESALLNLMIKIPAGPAAEQIQLKSNEWAFGLDFHSFGYHLSNVDFESNKKRKLPAKFFFHRVSDEFELKIVSSKNEKVVPVSKQMNAIELKKGQYQFTLIGPDGRKTIEVEIQ